MTQYETKVQKFYADLDWYLGQIPNEPLRNDLSKFLRSRFMTVQRQGTLTYPEIKHVGSEIGKVKAMQTEAIVREMADIIHENSLVGIEEHTTIEENLVRTFQLMVVRLP